MRFMHAAQVVNAAFAEHGVTDACVHLFLESDAEIAFARGGFLRAGIAAEGVHPSFTPEAAA
eukprot:11203963-Lingulodinium_polyedra.AAC.1